MKANLQKGKVTMNDVKVLNMKEEDLDDVSEIIALHVIKKEVSVKYKEE